MASPDHLKLSTFIKSMHEQLRQDSKLLGAEEAWNQHTKNEDNLNKYASAMQQLAVDHWEKNHAQRIEPLSRIKWASDFCNSYFYNEGILLHRQKELQVALKMNLVLNTTDLRDVPLNNQIKLLDVGSCYNPFKNVENFNVTAIDIAPATNSDVQKCDFLKLTLVNRAPVIRNSEMQTESFDVVIFSLFLEYLPSAHQRLLCCQNAYSLLSKEGILIVITPDSKHVGANAKIMKSWRHILANMGLSRVKYEKLRHLHCMVFRKCIDKRISARWALLHDEQLFSEMVIPQDFNEKCTANLLKESCDVDLFMELPLHDC